jgi:hypothetical protein
VVSESSRTVIVVTAKAGRVSVEDDECSGWSSTSKMTENVEKIRELIHEDHCWTIHELTGSAGISYGVWQEILTENMNMHHAAPSWQCAHPHISENHRVCDSDMVIVPHLPYSPDLAPCDFFVFQIENEMEGTTFCNTVWHPKGIASGTWQH